MTTTQTSDKVKTSCLLLLIMIPLTPFTVMWRGFVLTKLWAWFAIPVFQLPILTLPAAMGITLIINYLTYQTIYTKDERPSKERIIASIANVVLSPAMALLLGWIFNHWMPV